MNTSAHQISPLQVSMPKMPKDLSAELCGELDIDLKLGLDSSKFSKKILSILVYEAHGFRILLELFFAFSILSILFFLAPIISEGPISVQIMTVSLVCLFLVAIDSQFLCSSCLSSRQAFLSSLSGDYEKAISFYRKSMKSLAPPSVELYFLALSEVFALRGDLILFNAYIQRAIQYGSSKRLASFYFIRGIFFSNSLTDQDLFKELDLINKNFPNDPMIQVELSLIYLAKGKISLSKSSLNNVLKTSSTIHPSGLDTRDLGLLIKMLIDLKQGEDEVRFELDHILRTLKKELDFLPTLAPYLSLAYLIRKDLFDKERAISTCQYPLHMSLI